jgi:hypothetical protein
MIDPKWFIGEVIDFENDPERLGRVKVKIYQKHDMLSSPDQFVWSHVMMPTTSESLKGVGQTPSFALGTRVVGFFTDGKSERVPVITGTLLFNPIEDTGSAEHSLAFTARGRNDIEKKKIGYEEPDSSFAAEYPYNKVTRTKAGHVIEVDDTPGKERIHVYHKAGAYVEINKEGTISISTPKNSLEIVGGDKVLEVKGDCRVLVEGDLDASVMGNTRISSVGDLYVGCAGNMELSAVGGLTISAGGGILLKSDAGVIATGSITTLGALSSAIGATTAFTTPTGKIVSVSKGVITKVE